ncbi:maleylpyruvate isomerase N-terminal domain-containing protein [Nocardioides mangrovi]|uniref:Maleylpyruvate isomerase family mycothiol-dependent enzyme n=1 Tax=Nocardioides mangrovi TaxID=2874580 RepID=A0ABS7UBP5_9ACTN|nr:maleylpyruvate isomerase N-terminal domain-containing protein [Nocardioides mangrovi]MBZ5738254.1 maleylpyruvate isomerase family mycothiol-dependent enzyme [Nocardioides mangrovi]
MPTELTVAQHLEGLRVAMVAFVRYADRAGLDAPVPTRPGWTVRDLVARQGEAHHEVAARVRGEEPGPAEPIADEPLEWLRDRAIELVEAFTRAPHDIWARRACHQTTMHAVDALAAAFGRAPDPAETWISPELAADGIDDLLTGLPTPATVRLRADAPAVLLVAPDDVPDWWLVRIGPRPAVVQHGAGPRPAVPVADWELRDGAVALYLAFWDRSARPMSRRPRSGPPLWSA